MAVAQENHTTTATKTAIPILPREKYISGTTATMLGTPPELFTMERAASGILPLLEVTVTAL